MAFMPLTDSAIADSLSAVVIDKDTGTVLGTNLVLCFVGPSNMEEVLSSDSAAIEFANDTGKPLFAEYV